MVLLINIATLVFLFVSPMITTAWINTIQMLTMLGCFVLVRFFSFYLTITTTLYCIPMGLTLAPNVRWCS
jgi:hypothetical protein